MLGRKNTKHKKRKKHKKTRRHNTNDESGRGLWREMLKQKWMGPKKYYAQLENSRKFQQTDRMGRKY